jgi:hypothetical protein
MLFTTGDPEGSLVAGIGSLALRKDGSGGATLYIKESGVGDTGWTAVDVIPQFIDLTDTPAVYTADKWLKVNAGGTALEFTDPPTVALGNFNELNDVPPSYGGFGGFVVAVNLAESGLTFTNAAVGAFTDLSDTPAALIADKYLQVNGTGTALIFVDSTTGITSLGDIVGNDMSGASDYELPYAQSTGGLPEDNEFAYTTLLNMLQDTNFVSIAPTDGQILGYTTLGGVAWQDVPPPTANQYYDRVRDPVTNGDPVNPELLFDTLGDVIMNETYDVRTIF